MKKISKSQMQILKKLPFKYQILAIVFILIALNFAYFSSFFKEYSLERVIDGDTVIVYRSGEELKIRLHGIDAPESKQKYGMYCTKVLKRLLGDGQNLRIEFHGRDKYQRQIATIFANGKDINQQMVQQGCAWAYRYYSKKYVADEEAARAKGVGLWKDKDAQNPREFRLKHNNKY